MTTPLPEPWGDAQIREAFIYDGGESEYRDPINGASEQRRTAGKIFDSWLAEHDAALVEKLAESYVYVHGVTRTQSQVYAWLREKARQRREEQNRG